MLKFVYPKINIGLNITGKREDGYHTLQTIFYPLNNSSELCDILEIIPSDKDELILLGDKIDCRPEKNLVWKALTLYKREVAVKDCYKIVLMKKLPSQAGMGGGSSDASATLLLLNEISYNKLSPETLHTLALQLGADCPFFLHDSACFATGIGDELEQIEFSLNDYSILIVKPEEKISTAEAFKYIKPQADVIDLKVAIREPISQWKSVITNDFENSIFELHPNLKLLKQNLYNNKALYVSMTGSGSAFYAIYETKDAALAAASLQQIPAWVI